MYSYNTTTILLTTGNSSFDPAPFYGKCIVNHSIAFIAYPNRIANESNIKPIIANISPKLNFGLTLLLFILYSFRILNT